MFPEDQVRILAAQLAYATKRTNEKKKEEEVENQLTTVIDDSALEQVLIGGDLSKLSPAQRVQYYKRTCESIGLNPLTRPFDYIVLNGKLTLYAKKDAADQLRSLKGVSIDDVNLQDIGDMFVVKVKGHDSTGRSDVEIGVVRKSDMQGNIANAQMKAVTKAKRRLTLSLCGLGWLDETEIETIPDAETINVSESGEIVKEDSNDKKDDKETHSRKVKYFTPEQIQAVIGAFPEEKIEANHASAILSLSKKLTSETPVDLTVRWALKYRVESKKSGDKHLAADIADSEILGN